MYKIYVDGLSIFPHVSVGSQALVISTLQILNRKFPDAIFYFTSGNPAVELAYLKRMPYKFNVIQRPTSYLKFIPVLNKVVNEVDLIVSPWGDAYITFAPHRMLRKVMLLKRKSTPFLLVTSSVGPFGEGIKKFIAKMALKKFNALTVRDTITFDYFKELGFNDTKLIPDTAFVLESCSKDRVSEIFKKEDVNCEIGKYVCLNVSVLLLNKMRDARLDYVSMMVDLVEFLRKLTSLPIILVPHQIYSDVYKKQYPVTTETEESFDGDDRVPMKLIYNALENKSDVYQLHGDYYCDEYKGVIKGSEVFVGGRMHTVIGATSACVPSVVMQYSHKSLGLMKFLELEDYVWDVKKDVKELYSCVEKLWNNRISIRQGLEKTMPKIIEDAYSVSDIAERLLKG